MASQTYEPRSRVAVLVERLRQEPTRIFTSHECAQIMDCKQAAVSPTVEYAIKARVLFRRNTGKRVEYSVTEMPGSVVLPPAKRRGKVDPDKPAAIEQGWATNPDDPRIGKVVDGWKPPVMRHVRAGQ